MKLNNIIETEELDELLEAVKRQFKRYGTEFKQQYRCMSGPKKGRLVTSPEKCGFRKDPKKVRQGKRASRMKKGTRIRKTQMAKKRAPSKRLVNLNRRLSGK